MEKSEIGKPLISVITVVYNSVNTIERTIQSVLHQPYTNKEYIIIDGGSTDGTADIIRRYEDQLSYWVSEPDKGIFDAMNKGITRAKGDLIGIINADDWYEKDIFSSVADTFANSDGETVIHGLLRNFKNGQFYSVKGNSTRVLRYDMIQHPTCFIPRTLYRKYGSYDTRYKYSADYDLILRYLNRGVRFEFLEKVIANFTIGGISSEGKAQSEKYHILRRHQVIPGREAVLRLILLNLTNFTKKLLSFSLMFVCSSQVLYS